MGLELDERTLPGWSGEVDNQTRLVLRGPQGSERDPREFLTYLLAAEHPQWRDWALAELEERQDPDSGSLWYGYAAAREWLRRADSVRAAERAEGLVIGWPEFSAGWDRIFSGSKQAGKKSKKPAGKGKNRTASAKATAKKTGKAKRKG